MRSESGRFYRYAIDDRHALALFLSGKKDFKLYQIHDIEKPIKIKFAEDTDESETGQ